MIRTAIPAFSVDHFPDMRFDLTPAEARAYAREGYLSPRKVSQFNNKIIVTDPETLRAPWRVYPYQDEADLIVKHIQSKNYHHKAQAIIEIGCGVGPVAIA